VPLDKSSKEVHESPTQSYKILKLEK
jgi:hypothetical protein